MLRDRQLDGLKFRRQVAIGPYVADFACYDARLIVELDGSQHAESRRDTVRDRWFADDGYRVLRIWNNDLTRNRTGVLEAIWSALQYPSSGPSDHLLPQGEKGSRAPAPASEGADVLLDPSRNAVPPSPLAGEGALRAGEGAAP